MRRRLTTVCGMALALGLAAGFARADEKLEGYAEWRRPDVLVIDGQRVRPAAGMRFKGDGEARSFATIPLGYEVKVKGVRASDGSVLAREVEARRNGDALFEGDLIQAFDETERRFLRAGRVFDEDDEGRITEDYGRLVTRGPEVQRVRSIVADLLPPYLGRDGFRVYVVDNKDWNALAAPNRSLYVFRALLEALDDDELAIILGHEVAHATHEHSRRGFKKRLLVGLGALVALAAEEAIDSKAQRIGAQVGTLLAASALQSGHGRRHEDQADRVGLRYAFEAGYDVSKAPGLWRRFARKYGNGNAVVTFLFGDHSTALARARKLEREIALNYQ